MNYLKVPAKVDELCAILQEKQKTVGAFREQYELSFNAHLNLVTIHPWVDGNGRTVRLLMNYIQFCYHLFPTKIFKEDREEYAGYNTMTAEQKKNVDVKGLSNFMRRSLCVIAVLMIVSYFVMVARSVNEKAVSVVSTMLIPIIGSIYMVVKAQRYDRNGK